MGWLLNESLKTTHDNRWNYNFRVRVWFCSIQHNQGRPSYRFDKYCNRLEYSYHWLECSRNHCTQRCMLKNKCGYTISIRLMESSMAVKFRQKSIKHYEIEKSKICHKKSLKVSADEDIVDKFHDFLPIAWELIRLYHWFLCIKRNRTRP